MDKIKGYLSSSLTKYINRSWNIINYKYLVIEICNEYWDYTNQFNGTFVDSHLFCYMNYDGLEVWDVKNNKASKKIAINTPFVLHNYFKDGNLILCYPRNSNIFFYNINSDKQKKIYVELELFTVMDISDNVLGLAGWKGDNEKEIFLYTYDTIKNEVITELTLQCEKNNPLSKTINRWDKVNDKMIIFYFAPDAFFIDIELNQLVYVMRDYQRSISNFFIMDLKNGRLFSKNYKIKSNKNKKILVLKNFLPQRLFEMSYFNFFKFLSDRELFKKNYKAIIPIKSTDLIALYCWREVQIFDKNSLVCVQSINIPFCEDIYCFYYFSEKYIVGCFRDYVSCLMIDTDPNFRC